MFPFTCQQSTYYIFVLRLQFISSLIRIMSLCFVFLLY